MDRRIYRLSKQRTKKEDNFLLTQIKKFMQKKHIYLSLTFVGVIFIVLASGFFYFTQLRGVLPAILPPIKNTGQNSSNNDTKTTTSPKADENTTGIPFVMPDGFSIQTFAKDLTAPRVLVLDPTGSLLVSVPKLGRVYALPDQEQDGTADEQIIVAKDLNKPHGLAFHCPKEKESNNCQLFIAEEHQVTKWDYDEKTAKAQNSRKILSLPTGGNHTSRTIEIFQIQGQTKLLVSVGSSCNVCVEKDSRRASIWYSNLDGSDYKPFATGLRNTVFFKEHPLTKEIWGTDMGRDLLGDETPPDEINIIPAPNASILPPPSVWDFGWPYCYGKSLEDLTFDAKRAPDHCKRINVLGSHLDLPAHSAPLGLSFVPPNENTNQPHWPKEYWHNLFVAYHGSWNRSTPTGYKIVRFQLDEAGAFQGETDFLTGFLSSKNTKQAFGRPVDLLVLPNGTMYITDDKAGAIYKVKVTQP